MPSFSIYTLGCKVNLYDSEVLRKSFIAAGYIEKDEKEITDIFIINTCSVTNNATQKAKKLINRLHRLNPNAIMCVVGCYAQTNPKEIKELEGVDLVVGNQNKEDLINIVERFIKSNEKPMVKDVSVNYGYESEVTLAFYKNRTRGFVKIQDGCNNYCSFCIIPTARGHLRSRNPELIFKEIKELLKSGVQEIVLTGIHTAGYGSDMENYSFTTLLKNILKESPDLKRLRISSIEASQISSEFIELLKNDDRLVKHLHVPLQSGSDEILEKMNRHYNTREYLSIIRKLQWEIPDIALTTDVIVGFPEENEKHFMETFEFIKEVGFSELHVFPYSKRDNTPAADMEQVPILIKKIRVKKLMDLNEILALEFIKKNQNKILEVLFEESKEEGKFIGYSREYIRIEVISNKNLKNEIRNVKIIKPEYPVSLGELN